MKLFTLPILTLLALITFVSAASDFQNAVKCGKRFPRINQAIEIFCNKQAPGGKLTNDLTVPSKYASGGVGTTSLKNSKILVAIKGNCSPAQWIPHNWCLAQFHDLCANTKNRHGFVSRNFGNNRCQQFVIEPRSDKAFTRGPRGGFVPVGFPINYKQRAGG